MPELPEVEVTRAGLVDRLAGAQVHGARLGKPLRWPLGLVPDELAGTTAGVMQRRGKYLWLPLRRAGLEGGLLMHLGMSGSLALLHHAPPPGPHEHFDLATSAGTLRLTDPRRFGAVLWSDGLDLPPAAALLARLGREPFDPTLTPEVFHQALKVRRCAVKLALLAGDIVVGAGNIYASEALFAAGIHPGARCNTISRPRATRLLAAVQNTLARAIELGGSTLRDFRDVHGLAGAFQSQAQVYDRAGQPCLRCGATVKRWVQGQRATYFCASCQKR